MSRLSRQCGILNISQPIGLQGLLRDSFTLLLLTLLSRSQISIPTHVIRTFLPPHLLQNNLKNENGKKSRQEKYIEKRVKYTSMHIVIFFHSNFVFFVLQVLPRLTYFREFSMNALLIFSCTFCYFPPLISYYTCSSYFPLFLFIDSFSPPNMFEF
jgi:hypothetical protein